MRFADLDLLGIYVAPIVPLMIAAALVLFVGLRLVERFGSMPRVWHPALFHVALYVVVLSLIVIVKGSL
ncbi:DUF1656 domain-containing protein [Methylobacterium mesophilicum SR1.6/6]|uniref:DUF1656 domain-containing protein n=1 Tax=Methylobacterium mesophilicum SR1.6/6 TaxID=908290 RepID=A0A6B9FM32_9HYPH|nr:DUF1656 domain-containing protein [Methylobacterium mesophilicum]QGY03603.1 DUF1656 domain-containing protein [Methylobacterium mesophilicum SR1.6/6]